MAAPLLAAGALDRPCLLGGGGVASMALSRGNKQLAWIFAAIIVVGVCAYFGAVRVAEDSASSQSQTNYENQLAGCRRNQPVRVGNYSFYTVTAQARHKSARNDRDPVQRRIDAKFAREAKKLADNLLKPADVRADGSVDCKEAIHHP